jgi:hypothetical protein
MARKATAAQFLKDHIANVGDACVMWPFHVLPTGYGELGFEGKMYRAHRLMCTWAHGPAPTNEHCAAHSCHNRACVNPRHLSWKTPSENMRDKRQNGTNAPLKGKRGYSLTPATVAEIRALIGTETVTSLAVRYGVSRSTINKVASGELWAPGSKGYRLHERLTRIA